MRDFPSCFSENGVQVADASSCSSVSSCKPSQNSVTCVYKCKILDKSCLISIIWTKNLMGQCLSIEIDEFSTNQFICKVDVKPSFFSKRKGSKCLSLNPGQIEVFWDLSSAKFGSGPDPKGSYYIGIVCKKEMVLLIGDMAKEAFKKTCAVASFISTTTLVCKKEHVFGKRVLSTKAQFSDDRQVHDLKIECETNTMINNDPFLVVRIDGKTVMKVDHIRWKFRGNCAILVDGSRVEVFWDVHNWFFGPSLGNGVFVFHTCLSTEKLGIDSTTTYSCSDSFKESSKVLESGFSLCLYAWMNE